MEMLMENIISKGNEEISYLIDNPRHYKNSTYKIAKK